MNLSSGSSVSHNVITLVPLTNTGEKVVEEYTGKEMIHHIEFSNKKDVESLNANWIAGEIVMMMCAIMTTTTIVMMMQICFSKKMCMEEFVLQLQGIVLLFFLQG